MFNYNITNTCTWFIAYKTDLLKCAKKLTKSSGSVSSLYDTNLEYNKQLDNI